MGWTGIGRICSDEQYSFELERQKEIMRSLNIDSHHVMQQLLNVPDAYSGVSTSNLISNDEVIKLSSEV